MRRASPGYRGSRSRMRHVKSYSDRRPRSHEAEPTMVGRPKAPTFDETFVYKGRDGWLFLIGGSNSVSSLYDRSSVLAGDDTKWADLIEQRARRFEAMGI